MKKPMTIEYLAKLMDKKFTALDIRLDETDKKIDSEVEKLASITMNNFMALSNTLSGFMKETERRFDEIEQNFSTIRYSLLYQNHNLKNT